jgi:hypothetical protein
MRSFVSYTERHDSLVEFVLSFAERPLIAA